jgi:clan AA aspartic protease, TIGR02281 family
MSRRWIRWLAVVALGGLVVLALYTYRQPILASLERKPPPATARTAPPQRDWTSDRTLRLRADPDGRFFIFADVEGVPVRFLLDDRAAGVVLSPEDAARVGLRPRERDFTPMFRTANGIVRAAPVTLREVRIGALSLRDVDAVVNERPIGVSLLGKTFLGRLDGYSARNGELILAW